MRKLIALALLPLAFNAGADEPGTGPMPGVATMPGTATRPDAAARAGAVEQFGNVFVVRRADGSRLITSRGDSSQTVALLERTMTQMKAREARDWRDMEALRREREAEAQAALAYQSECYRHYGDKSCVTTFK